MGEGPVIARYLLVGNDLAVQEKLQQDGLLAVGNIKGDRILQQLLPVAIGEGDGGTLRHFLTGIDTLGQDGPLRLGAFHFGELRHQIEGIHLILCPLHGLAQAGHHGGIDDLRALADIQRHRVSLLEEGACRRLGADDAPGLDLIVELLLRSLHNVQVEFAEPLGLLDAQAGGAGLVSHHRHHLPGTGPQADRNVDGNQLAAGILANPFGLRALTDDLAFRILQAVFMALFHQLEYTLDRLQLLGLLYGHAYNAGDLIFRNLLMLEAVHNAVVHLQNAEIPHTGHNQDQDQYLPPVAPGLIVILVVIIVLDRRRIMILFRSGHPRIWDILGRLISAARLPPQLLGGIFKVDVGIFAECLQVRQHLVGGGVALVPVRSHGLHADLFQRFRNLRVDLPGAQGHRTEMLDGHTHRVRTFKGQPAGEHLIKYHAGGVDIAAVVGVVSLGLLRRNVVYGADCLVGRVGAVGEKGDAEIRHLHRAVPEDHNVLRLDIPVNNPPAVSMAEPLHDLGNEVEGLRPVQPSPPLHILLEGNAVNKFHDNIVHVPPAAHVVHRHNVGVAEHGDSLRLIVEPAAELRILAEIFFQHLDGHHPVEPVALGLEYHRHAPGPDNLQDLIAVIQHLSYVSFHSQAFLSIPVTAGAAARRSHYPARPAPSPAPAAGRDTGCPPCRAESPGPASGPLPFR